MAIDFAGGLVTSGIALVFIFRNSPQMTLIAVIADLLRVAPIKPSPQ